MSLLNWKGYAASAAVGALLAGSLAAWGAWSIQENSYERQLSDLKAEHAETLRGVTTAAAEAAEKALAQQKQDQTTIAELDERRTKEKVNDQAEIARLAAAVAAGTQRLRIRATCPANPGGGSVSGKAGTASVDNAGTIELAPDARADYFTLVGQIKSDQASLLGLQEYVRNVCLKGYVP